MALNALGSSKPTPRLKIKTEVEAPEGVATDIEALVNESQSIIIKWKVRVFYHVVVASGRPRRFTPYPTMDSLSAFASEWQVSGT